jgi:hypothetical protein
MGAIIMAVAAKRAVQDSEEQGHGLMGPVGGSPEDITHDHFKTYYKDCQEEYIHHDLPKKNIDLFDTMHVILQPLHIDLLSPSKTFNP